ncbi:MAG: hypothetical protein ABSC23_03690 [Bryobacteraceae bacterium]|jgi:hypothetical protein
MATRHLLLTRGTEWRRLWNWRVRELRGEPKDWNLLTTSEPLAEYPSRLSPMEAARLAFAEFPDCRLYLRVDDPDAAPLRCENFTVARVMPTVAEAPNDAR